MPEYKLTISVRPVKTVQNRCDAIIRGKQWCLHPLASRFAQNTCFAEFAITQVGQHKPGHVISSSAHMPRRGAATKPEWSGYEPACLVFVANSMSRAEVGDKLALGIG